MSATTAIEWTQATWNPTKGCDRVSPGCDHCYALTMAKRLKGMGSPGYQQDGDPRTSGPGFLAHESPTDLDWPLHQAKPLQIFVNSMSDVFHNRITGSFIEQILAVVAASPQHTFQLLTKRHTRMKIFMSAPSLPLRVASWRSDLGDMSWPLPNLWLGVSVESQQWADIRIPALLDTPAAVRFLSCEPLLGPVALGMRWLRPLPDCPFIDQEDGCCTHPDNLTPECHTDVICPMTDQWRGIDWVIAGGESGPGARPMHPDWARSLRDQCTAASVPFLFKQWGEWAPGMVDVRRAVGIDRNGHALSDFNVDQSQGHTIVTRVGKKAAGRLLDGRTWDQYPEATR